MHQDPQGTSGWNVVAHGRKRWAMLSPQASSALAKRNSLEGGGVGLWFEAEWPSIRAEAEAGGLRTFDFTQCQGELVYVPAGWWHAVLNLEGSVAISHSELHRSQLAGALKAAAAAGRSELEAAVGAFGYEVSDEDDPARLAADQPAPPATPKEAY